MAPRSGIACVVASPAALQPAVPRIRWALPRGRGLEDCKPYPRRNVPYVKFPAARGGLGREEALPRSRGFLLDHEAAAQQKSGGPMLKSALEGLKGRRSRQHCECGVRDNGSTFPESDLFRMPQHLYPPSLSR